MTREDLGQEAVAAVVALIAAAVLFIIGVLLGAIVGQYTLNSEGRAWSFVSMGFPLGFIFAVVGGTWTFIRVNRYGEPPQQQ